MNQDKPLTPVELATAVAMLLGERHPDATVGMRRSPKDLTRLIYRAGDSTVMAVLIPYFWPFADAENPDEPVDDMVLVNAGSLRAAILEGSKSVGMLNIEPLGPPVGEVENPEGYDAHLLLTEGRSTARLRKRSLDRFRDRVRSTLAPISITGGFALNGDAAEFVKLGVFNADDELAISVHLDEFDGVMVTRTALSGERVSVIW